MSLTMPFKLLDWIDEPRDVADPWYTDDFDTTYTVVRRGCEALLADITSGER